MSPEDPILKQAGLNIARKLAEKYRSIDALSRVPMGDCQQGLGLLTELFELIDTQAAQIEALKEKLVEERSDRILRRQHDYEHNYSFTKSDALDLARQQLKAEMPEVEWE